MDEDKKFRFWESMLKAVETVPRNIKSLKGTTGLSYPIIAIGTDDSRRRVVIISGESNARSTAIAHADIQATLHSTKVIMVRPLSSNLSLIAEAFSEITGLKKFGIDELEKASKLFNDMRNATEHDVIELFGESLKNKIKNYTPISTNVASVNWASAVKNIVDQFFLIKTHLEKTSKNGSDKGKLIIDLSRLINHDPTKEDLNLGICPIPLYNFSENQIEAFHSGFDIEKVREILKINDIFQYFFPPPDHLALGLTEIAPKSEKNLIDHLQVVPNLGHPFGRHEIISKDVSLVDLIDSLKSKDLMVEGDTGIEITEQGKSIRASVKFKPREGFLKKLSNVLSIKLDLNLRDLWK